jgi:hypothetical protein
MAQAKGIRKIGYFDCIGGGQVTVDRNVAYIGHVKSPHGTTTIDVSDPRHPKLMHELHMPVGAHSHKVRVANDIMVINREVMPFRGAQSPDGFKGGNAVYDTRAPEGFKGGLGIYDVSRPGKPKLISNWETGGSGMAGVHRFDFDGRYAYISPTVNGYLGNIVMILDLRNPVKPEEVGRWWLPGQWTAGGEKPTWKGSAHRCHHPLRFGNRLYTSYWHGGFVILDIEDMAKPKMITHCDWSPPFTSPTHTVLPVPFKVEGRTLMIVADEDAQKLEPSPPAFMWIVDASIEEKPVPFATFQLECFDGSPQPNFTGCHQPCEKITGTEIPVAWFAMGLRVVDIARPHAPKEVAYYLPDVPEGQDRVQSNDVTVDDRGLIYLLDRLRGLTILERV